MENMTIMQYFEWYLPSDGSLWNKVSVQAWELKETGITDIWLPPAYKGAGGGNSVGYDVYDMYDLGEFDQKKSVRTKYGTRNEYLSAVNTLHEKGLRVMADVVLNQMMGAEETEKVTAIDTAEYDRELEISKPHEIEVWTRFTFPGRQGMYSSRTWGWENFTGTDLDQATGKKSVYLFEGKTWNDETDSENVNFDYLMGVNLDMNYEDTRNATLEWGKWYFDTVHPDGLRLDAVKHISFEFYREWLKEMRRQQGRDFFVVGEYWSGELDKLLHYLNVVVDGYPARKAKVPKAVVQIEEETEGENPAESPEENSGETELQENPPVENTNPENPENPQTEAAAPEEEELVLVEGTPMTLFDVPLHFQFLNAANSGGAFDMGSLFNGSLVQARAECAVTFVDNHDTQTGQALESMIPAWFKPIAYAMILLRNTGIPCVFYGDYYGIEHSGLAPVLDLRKLIAIRRCYAYGSQSDYFDDQTIVGFTRSGDEEHPNSGLAVLATNGDEGSKYMVVDKKFAGQNFYDALGRHDTPITLDEEGGAEFHVHGGYVSVWLNHDAYREIRVRF